MKPPPKKYCPVCEKMHELKEFNWIGNGMYGRQRICKKAHLVIVKERDKKLREQRKLFAQFSPI